jgi:hypothetical protein
MPFTQKKKIKKLQKTKKKKKKKKKKKRSKNNPSCPKSSPNRYNTFLAAIGRVFQTRTLRIQVPKMQKSALIQPVPRNNRHGT